jgi:hypothetical protein
MDTRTPNTTNLTDDWLRLIRSDNVGPATEEYHELGAAP